MLVQSRCSGLSYSTDPTALSLTRSMTSRTADLAARSTAPSAPLARYRFSSLPMHEPRPAMGRAARAAVARLAIYAGSGAALAIVLIR